MIAAAYDDEITDEQLRSLPGAGDAASVRVLKRQLDEGDVENVVEEPQEPAAYDDDHGRAADAVLERADELTTRSVTLDAVFPLDDGENAAVALANEVDAALLPVTSSTGSDG